MEKWILKQVQDDILHFLRFIMPESEWVIETKEGPLVLIGEITSAHGIKGEVKIRLHSDNPKDITGYKEIFRSGGNPVSVKIRSFNGDVAIASVDGAADRNAAELLAGEKLYIKKSALPPLKNNEYYLHDIIGCEARLKDGKKLGEVISVNNYGAGDIVEIALSDSKKTAMYLINKTTVLEVNIAKGYIILNPPEEV